MEEPPHFGFTFWCQDRGHTKESFNQASVRHNIRPAAPYPRICFTTYEQVLTTESGVDRNDEVFLDGCCKVRRGMCDVNSFYGARAPYERVSGTQSRCVSLLAFVHIGTPQRVGRFPRVASCRRACKSSAPMFLVRLTRCCMHTSDKYRQLGGK